MHESNSSLITTSHVKDTVSFYTKWRWKDSSVKYTFARLSTLQFQKLLKKSALYSPHFASPRQPVTQFSEPPRRDMADPNAKLQSLFGKNKLKKKKSTTVNANVIVKTSAQNAERAAVAAAEAAAAPKPAASGAPATGKKLSDLSLNRADDDVEKSAFQWAKQPKKYKNMDEKVRAGKRRKARFCQKVLFVVDSLFCTAMRDRKQWLQRGPSGNSVIA